MDPGLGFFSVVHRVCCKNFTAICVIISGYTRMCNHCAIALGRYAVDHGIVKGVSPETIVKIQCPCGLVTAHVEYQDGRAGAVRIDSVPCFVFATDLTINLGKCVCV